MPGEQLDEHRAAQFAGLGRPYAEVRKHRVERLGRDEIGDLLNEFALQRERLRHEVRDVATCQDLRIDLDGKQLFEPVAEIRDSPAQDGRVERHVDAGHEDEGAAAAERVAQFVDFHLKPLETGDRAGDRILRIAEVVVDDFEELTGRFGNAFDEPADGVIVESELRRTDRGKTVVAASRAVTGHQGVHDRPTLEHDFDDGFKRDDFGDCGERVVFADRVAGQHRTLDEVAGLTKFGHLGRAERRHGGLSELRQEQHSVGVTVCHAVGFEHCGVVSDDAQDRESEGLARMHVGAVPDVAGGLGPTVSGHAHALALDALAGERVGRARSFESRRGGHDEFAVGAAGDVDDFGTVIEGHAVGADLDNCSRAKRREETRRPTGDAAMSDCLLGCSREPHAVNDRFGETG